MIGAFIYLVGIIANSAIIYWGCRSAYRAGVKYGIRCAVINVLKNENIVSEHSQNEKKQENNKEV